MIVRYVAKSDTATFITYSTDYYQRLTLESWFPNLEQTPLNRSYQHRTNDLLTESSKTNFERTTEQLTIWPTINDCLTVKIDGLFETHQWHYESSLMENNITA